MTWLELYSYLNERANNINAVGEFPWQENVEVWDWETLDYYPTDFIQTTKDSKISLVVDTYQSESN
jgi:hypothetical protein